MIMLFFMLLLVALFLLILLILEDSFYIWISPNDPYKDLGSVNPIHAKIKSQKDRILAHNKASNKDKPFSKEDR